MAQEQDGDHEAEASGHAPDARVGRISLVLCCTAARTSSAALCTEHLLQGRTTALTIV
jgi:hypothetical protein